MRKFCMFLSVALGAVAVALTARYGWQQAEHEADRVIAAIVCGSIAGCAFIFDAVAVRLWFSGLRKGAAVIGLIAAYLLVLTFSNSLGGIVSRSDAVEAKRRSVTDSKADDRRALARFEKQLLDLGTFTVTDQATVAATKAAADTATSRRVEECENRGRPGDNCRAREREEKGANDTWATATSNRATTMRATNLETEIKAVKAALSTGDAVAHANPLGNALALLIGDAAEVLTARMQAMIALGWELCIVGLMVGSEMLKHAPSQIALVAVIGGKSQRAATADPMPLVEPKANEAQRPKPTLAVTNRKPIGAVLDFLLDGVQIVNGPPTPMVDAYITYSAWCRTSERRPLDVAEFLEAMESACEQSGMRIETRGDKLFMNVCLVTARRQSA